MEAAPETHGVGGALLGGVLIIKLVSSEIEL
jgi:hypothetical protein